jgi:hypothetical protein
MSQEKPNDDSRRHTDLGSHKQTEEPWKGNPEKEQRSGTDPDKWQETNALGACAICQFADFAGFEI